MEVVFPICIWNIISSLEIMYFKCIKGKKILFRYIPRMSHHMCAECGWGIHEMFQKPQKLQFIICHLYIHSKIVIVIYVTKNEEYVALLVIAVLVITIMKRDIFYNKANTWNSPDFPRRELWAELTNLFFLQYVGIWFDWILYKST